MKKKTKGEDDDEPSYQSVTKEEYLEVRQTLEDSITEYADNILNKGIAQDLVAELITSIGGYVVYYKKETKKEICYDWAIGMPICRNDYR